MLHTCGVPDLQRLSSEDAEVVGRALAKLPADRFSCCLEFVRALMNRPAKTDKETAREGDKDTGTSSLLDSLSSRLSLPNAACPAPAGSQELLPGFRFQRCLERSPLTEVWQVLDSGGRPRQVKFIYGFDQRRGTAQREAVARLKSLTHPALIPAEVLDSGPGRLALITDPPGKTLREYCQECRGKGHPGIPRLELYHYLADAASALDVLYGETGLSHLALTPRSLLLDGDLLYVADFGLVPLFWLPAGRAIAQINPRYAAPELFRKQISCSSDQYSLALIVHELITGVLPKALGRSRGGLTHAGKRSPPPSGCPVPD
jgi:serine/threonine protein kinase